MENYLNYGKYPPELSYFSPNNYTVYVEKFYVVLEFLNEVRNVIVTTGYGDNDVDNNDVVITRELDLKVYDTTIEPFNSLMKPTWIVYFPYDFNIEKYKVDMTISYEWRENKENDSDPDVWHSNKVNAYITKYSIGAPYGR